MKDHHIQTFKDSSLTFKMIHIEGGIFDMGSNDVEATNWEKLVYTVHNIPRVVSLLQGCSYF